MCGSSGRAATPRRCGCAMTRRRARAVGHRPGRRRGARDRSRRSSRAATLTVAFNAQFLLDGIDAASGRRGRARDDRPAEAGGARRHRAPGLPVPPDAGAHLLSRSRDVSSRPPLAAGLPLLRRPSTSSSPTGVHGGRGRERRRARRACSRPSAGSRRPVVPGGSRRRARALRRAKRRSCAPTVEDAGPRRSWSKPSSALVGRNRVLREPAAARPHARSARQLRVTVFAPDDLALVKGGPAERRDYLDDLLVARRAALRRRPRRLRARAAAPQRAAAAGSADPTPRSTLDVFDEQLAGPAASWCGAGCGSSSGCHPRSRDGLRGARRRRRRGRCATYEAEWAEGSSTPTARRRRGRCCAPRSRAAPRRDRPGGHPGRPHRDEWRLVLDGLDARDPRLAGGAAHARARAAPRRATGCSPRSSAPSRCSSSTTCSASSTRHGPRPSSPSCPRARR